VVNDPALGIITVAVVLATVVVFAVLTEVDPHAVVVVVSVTG
jgi:hypothetical protein